MIKKQNLLKKTLWFQIQAGPLVEFDVWYPACISGEEQAKFLAKYASQCIEIIWQLRNKIPTEMIVQGQYASETPFAKLAATIRLNCK